MKSRFWSTLFASCVFAMLGFTAKAVDSTYEWTGAAGPDADGVYDFLDKGNWTKTAGSDANWPRNGSGVITASGKSYDLNLVATDEELKLKMPSGAIYWKGTLNIADGGKYRFVGTNMAATQKFNIITLGAAAALTLETMDMELVNNAFTVPSDALFTMIGATMRATSTGNYSSSLKGALTLKSGSSLDMYGNIYCEEGGVFLVEGDSTLYIRKVFSICNGSNGEPSELTIDNATVIVGTTFNICSAGRSGSIINFKGQTPRLLAKGGFGCSSSSNGIVGNFNFNIPAGGYEMAPFIVGTASGAFPGNGNPTVVIDGASAVFASDAEGTFPLIAAAGGYLKNLTSTSGVNRWVLTSALPDDAPDGAEAQWQYSGNKATVESSFPFTPTLPEIEWANAALSSTCILGVYIKGNGSDPDDPDDPVEPDQPTAPKFASFAADGSAGDTITVAGAMGVGGTVTVEVSESADFAAVYASSDAGAVATNGNFEATFHRESTASADYIMPGATYYVRAIATSLEAGCDLATTSAVKTVTTAAGSGVSVTGFSHPTGSASVTVSGKVDPRGAGTSVVWIDWCMDGVAFDNRVKAAEIGPNDAATWSKTIDMGVGGKAFCYKISVSNACATASWATEPVLGAGSETPISGATIYYWKGKDGSFVGDWADPGNWDANDPDHYYPDLAQVAAGKLTVDFTSVQGHAARITLPSVASAVTLGFESTALKFPTDGYNIHFVAPAGNEITFTFPNTIAQNNIEFGLEGVKTVTLGSSEVYLKGVNQTFVFKDTTVNVSATKSVRVGEGAGSNHTLVFDNATLNASGGYRGIILNSANDTIVVKGRSPKLYLGHLASLYSTEAEYNSGRLVFEIPSGGFASTPIDGTGSSVAFNVRQNGSTQGKLFRIEVDRASPIFNDPTTDWKAQTLITWPRDFTKTENLLLDTGTWSTRMLNGQLKPLTISGTTIVTEARGTEGLSFLVMGSASAEAPVAAGVWFETGIADLKAWPASGDDLAVGALGTWSHTGGAMLSAGGTGNARLEVTTGGAGDAVTFTPNAARTVGANALTLTSSLAFTPSTVLPTWTSDLKGALTVLRTVKGAATNDVYYGWAKNGDVNGWVALTGATPKTGEPVAVSVAFTAANGRIVTVAYAVDGVPLTVGGASALATVQADAKIGAAGFSGVGRVLSLDAAAEGAAATVMMTVPASFENMAIAEVQANGVAVAANPDGSYTLDAEAAVSVKFTAAEGYRLVTSTMAFTAASTDFALPAEGLPVPVEGYSNVRINEVMASNGETLARADGAKGIDWIELYNEGDEPVSLAGWYFTDNADEMKEKKWEKIKGNASLPAHGYLVIFADSDLGGWDEREAWTELGLSGNGEKLTLITPEKKVADQMIFDQQFEDVSVGLDGDGKLAYFHTPTPWAENPATGVNGLKPAVTLSEPHGYKTAPFLLTMTCADPDATIYYTTDGTQPTTSSTPYSAPIEISATTVIRAAAAGVDAILQRDTVATYLFLDDIVDQTTAVQAEKLTKSYGPGMRKSRLAGDESLTQRFYDAFTNSEHVCTLSIVIDPKNFFNDSDGIYVKATNSGREWERPTMLEQINPLDATDEFSVPCGIRIRGAFSRQNSPKHGFHLYFRSQYGMSKLNFPLFGKDGPDKFDKIDLKTDQNQTYYGISEGRSAYQTLVHELFGRDCERDFGKTYNRSRYFNLFINGVYWGVYMYEERCSQGNAAENSGGTDENYDVVRTDHETRVTSVVEGLPDEEGTDKPYRDFWNLCKNQGFAGEYADNFNRVRGLNPDGTRNPAYPIYLNVTNLIGNVFSSHYGADTDSPCNTGGTVNNINAYRNRVDGDADEEGWIFNRHDCEWTLAFNNGNVNGAGSHTYDNCGLGATSNSKDSFNPHGLHYYLADPVKGSAEYRMVFADQVYRHFVRKGGTMTVEKCTERFQKRMADIYNAIIAEQVRWAGDSVTPQNWLEGCGKCLNYITNRSDYLVRSIYRDKYHWYPSIDAPTALDASGETVTDGAVFAEGEKVTLANASQGTVYYTLDGTDPRLSGGAKSAKALTYTEPFAPPAGVSQVRARILSANGEWSALEEVTVKSAAAASGADPKDALRVAEVMSSSACADGDADDYLVLTNLADEAVSLANVKIVAWNAKKKSEADPSLTLVFGASDEIAAGGSLKLTAADFAGGKLTNSDVGLRLYDVSGVEPVLFQDCYVSGGWFGGSCDGQGGAFIALEFGAEVKTESQWKSSLEPEVPQGDDVEGDGFLFILAGEYETAQTITPTGAECRVVLNGAKIPDGLVLDGAAKFTFEPAEGTVNEIGQILGNEATVKLDGKGAVKLEGPDTLVSVSNLNVKAGVFAVKTTGVTLDKTPVVNVLGYAKQSGGTIDIDLENAGLQAYGIYIANKDLKDALGEKLGLVYGEFGGGALNATVGGTKSAAVYGNKGSANVTFKAGETVTANLVGTEARFVNSAGKLKLQGGDFTVTSTASDARVFKCDREITVSDGVYRVNATGAGSEIFSTSKNKDGDPSTITITGGTFELVATDDCFNADDNITVSGGLVYAVSTANDVFDSNGDMTLSGGTILAYALGAGHEAFDVEPMATEDNGIPHVLHLNGGTIFGTGGAGALWPASVVTTEGVNVYQQTELTASEYSEKYISLVGGDTENKTTSAVKLPALAGETFALFATAPGYDGAAPTVSATAPEKGARDFHDLYVWSDTPTNQEFLRFHTIYGSTAEGDDAAGTLGDVGEYIVLTNISDKTVILAGVGFTSAKVGKSPSCVIALTDGTVPAYGSVRLDQADFADRGWTKITNGSIAFALTDAEGNSIQSGAASFGLYEQCDGGGAALVAKYFGNDRPLAATTDDWAPSFEQEEPPEPPEPPVDPTEVTLAINEVMASNETTLSTPDGAEGLDWVELYNSGEEPVSLEGWKLTDDPDGKASKRKPILGATEIPAGGYLVVFLDKDKADWAEGVPHAAIGLSASGESIALIAPNDAVVSRYDFGAQFKDVSFGPGDAPGGIVYFANPTPGAANGDDGRLGPSPKVVFSVPHGYKTEAFELTMTSEDPDASVFYTLDGTSPTTASAKFTAPIMISKTTVVRARAIVEGATIAPIHEQDYSATYLFVEDIVRQSADTPEGFLPTYTANNNQQNIFYGMATTKFLKDDGTHITNTINSTVFKGTDRERRFQASYDVTQRLYDGFTNDFRTVSLVIDPKALFDSETGIYNHATMQGDAWERQTMIEQIHPGDEADEFSIACGIRIRGAVTRGNHYPKRAFHLSFRSQYGYSKLKHPLFGDEGADEFDKIDLRNDQTAYPGGANKESMVHELFSRDCQRDLGTTYNRTRYLNLFINGVYWGLYMYEERVNQDYAESYNKGAAEHYDVVRTNMKDENNVRQTCVVDGTNTWVKDFWLDRTLAEGYGANYPANYNRVRGLNPDGTRNPDYPVYLNVTNLIKYVLVSHYVADTDSPCNSQAAVNNIIAFRNRVDGEGKEDGWLWNRHDAEQSLAFGKEVKWDNAESYSSIDTADGAQKDNCLFGVFNGATMLGFKSDNVTVTDTDESHFNPHMLHYRLCDNAEYKTVFADQVYRHLLREGGAMTPTNNYLRYTARMHEIRNAMAGETARWAHNAAMQTSADYITWIRTCAANLAFLEIRTPYMIQIYRNHGWYPSVDAPTATKGGKTLMDGDKVDETEKVTLAGEGGTVYYTLDGSDPRLEGGAVNTAAVAYTAPFPVKTVTATVKARTLTAGGEWSALEEVTVAGVEPEPTYQEFLRFHSIYGSTAEGGDAGEYIVLTNISENAVTLVGLKVNVEKLADWTASGESASKCLFTLSEGTVPAWGGVTFNQADFWNGAKQKITNGDVYLALTDAEGHAIQSGTAAFGLYEQCDGGGAALVAKRFDVETPLAATTDDWAPSFELPAAEIIVVGPDGVTNMEEFVSVEDAVTNRPYGSLVEIPVVVGEPLAVTLEPGVKVAFAEGQSFGEGALTFKAPVAWYDVRNEGVEAWIELNDLAKPEFAAEGEAPGEEPIVVGPGDAGEVTLRVANVRPNLIYGVKASAALPALDAAEPANWTQADGEGRLPNGALTAPKPSPGAGFFTVTVTDDPRVL